MLVASSSIFSGSIHCRGWSGFGSILSSSTSTSTPPFATAVNGALPMDARFKTRSLMVSALLLTFSLRATCDDLLGELLVLDRLSLLRRVEQDRDSSSSGAPHGIALVDSGLEGEPAEDAADVPRRRPEPSARSPSETCRARHRGATPGWPCAAAPQ